MVHVEYGPLIPWMPLHASVSTTS